jgi:predicted anti-sigma-YlaC factor YlaD
MTCDRYQSDGMRLLDGEMSAAESAAYEEHLRVCAECRREMKSLGRVVRYSQELRLRVPDDDFWKGYWEGVYRRSERRAGFVLLIAGLVAFFGYMVFRAVTSPAFLTYEGISITIILVGLAVIFISVVRERFHERRNDPYREVER